MGTGGWTRVQQEREREGVEGRCSDIDGNQRLGGQWRDWSIVFTPSPIASTNSREHSSGRALSLLSCGHSGPSSSRWHMVHVDFVGIRSHPPSTLRVAIRLSLSGWLPPSAATVGWDSGRTRRLNSSRRATPHIPPRPGASSVVSPSYRGSCSFVWWCCLALALVSVGHAASVFDLLLPSHSPTKRACGRPSGHPSSYRSPASYRYRARGPCSCSCAPG